MLRKPHAASLLRIVCRGVVADVRMTEDVYAQYAQAIDRNDKLSVQRNAHLKRYFAEFANNVDYWKRMADDKFKKEGNSLMEMARWRLYGSSRRSSGGWTGVLPKSLDVVASWEWPLIPSRSVIEPTKTFSALLQRD
jgi:hypothetical protein